MRLALAAAVAVVATDLATKATMTTPLWAQHHRDINAIISHVIVGVLMVAIAGLSRPRYLQAAIAVTGAGALANGIDLIVTGWSHNPFVIVTHMDGPIYQRWAFNAADVAITVGACVTWVGLVWWMLHPTRSPTITRSQHDA